MNTRKFLQQAEQTWKFVTSPPAREAFRSYGAGAKPAIAAVLIMILGADLAHRDVLSLRYMRQAYSQWDAGELQKLQESLSQCGSDYEIGSVS
jgi:hypothetical protein